MGALFGEDERGKAISCKLILANMKEHPLRGLPCDKAEEICVDNLYGAELPDDLHEWLANLLKNYIAGESIQIHQAGQGARMDGLTLLARIYVAGFMLHNAKFETALKLTAKIFRERQEGRMPNANADHVRDWIFRLDQH